MAFKCNKKEYVTVQLNNLLIDERVADMVEEYGGVFPPYLLNNLYAFDTFKLDKKRLGSILEGYDTGDLPAISVKKTLGSKYQVLNGRHRVCATILRGGKTIVVEDV